MKNLTSAEVRDLAIATRFCLAVKKRPTRPQLTLNIAARTSHHHSALTVTRTCGLSDVTDRSDHWLGAFCRQIIPSLECFGRFRVECRFLGRKRPFLAFLGVG